MSSAIIESFEYMVIYENREDRSAATSMKPQKNSTFYSAAQWDLWSWNRNSPFHPWPHKSTFPEVLEKWPRTKWKANIAGVSHCSKILNFVQKIMSNLLHFSAQNLDFLYVFLGWLTLYRLKWVEFTNSLDFVKIYFLCKNWT